MSASEKVDEVYNELLSLGSNARDTFTDAERVVFDVVSLRRATDTSGFAHACQQLKQSEFKSLYNSLKQLGEEDLANKFRQVFQALKTEGYYNHKDWNQISADTKRDIESTGNRIGDRLRNLDEKLAATFDDPELHPQYEE